MANTKKAFVIGWPIEHSLSPIIHQYWLRQFGLDGSYEKLAINPADLSDFLKNFQSMGYVGGNVTLPHKHSAFQIAEKPDIIATKLQAANTLWLEDGRLCTTNTDAYGFAANLDDCAPGWKENALKNRGNAIVLGAGGASRAIIYVLQQQGFKTIHVVNRSIEKAQQLVQLFGKPVSAHEISQLPQLMGTAAILVNTTSLGMAGGQPLEIDLTLLPNCALVCDIIYTPLETKLLQAASARGLQTVDGLGMLLHQAVPGFEIWFQKRPTVGQELRQLVIDHLEAKK